MNVSILIGTFGDSVWRDLAWSHAYPSAVDQGAREVDCLHLKDGTLAEARNQLAETATGDWLCVLDADDKLGEGYLRAMRAGFEAWPSFAYRSHGPWEPASYPNILLVPAVQYVRDGCCVGSPAIPNRGGWPEVNECVIGTLIPRLFFYEVGGFRDTLDDGTPLTSLEDYDLFLRCFDAGAQLVYVPAAVYCAAVNGRNRDQSSYQAIWAEHLTRQASM